MRIRYIYYACLLWLLSACTTSHALVRYDYTPRRMTDSLRAYDHHIDSLIQPYRMRMEREMGTVIAVSDTILTRTQPESDLGNLLADILLEQTNHAHHVDIAVINFGGVRLQQLPAGNITLGTAFELMPFDNRVVLLRMRGDTLQRLFDHMAAVGGWPIAGARFTIHDHHATQIMIAGQALSTTQYYTIAISDYLANGGDKLDILKVLPQIATGKLLRDVFIDGFRDRTAHSQHLHSVRDGRVIKDTTDTNPTRH
jgi:2',3'-cyclic-nucleotide 2'-phosphodiesterase (5'-nucleotidase family)